MTIYVTSDTHFNHARIIELARRPFGGVDEMNQAMIDLWNLKVRERDEVHVLGDFGFANGYGWDLGEVFDSLNGIKHLTVGNHDTDGRNAHSKDRPGVLDLPWESVEQYRTVKWAKRHFVMFHFPIEDWERMNQGYIHLHGHSHGNAVAKPHRFDMGVDVPEWDFAPVSLETIISIADTQPMPTYGHHGG